jgi:hypothetical protein
MAGDAGVGTGVVDLAILFLPCLCFWRVIFDVGLALACGVVASDHRPIQAPAAGEAGSSPALSNQQPWQPAINSSTKTS